ncbi:aspartyl-phosphate phosphatase Spo0E family protein [Lihuaxuella thermophila]|nr:aspartyl-phosphate phosphatase Spo0E family protein [Lihuaxuella thermophila]
MWTRTLEERMEAVRKKMEDTAMILGLGHPKVYQLSRELDHLHNQWERECAKKKGDKIYRIHCNASKVKERESIQIYKVV